MTNYNNVNTEGKEACRKLIYNLVKHHKAKNKRVVTLPSTNFILEHQLTNLGNVYIDCFERELSRYKIQESLPHNTRVSLNYSNVLDSIPDNKYCLIALDLCSSISPRIINRCIELIQRDIFDQKAYICITFMGRREMKSKEMQDFYNKDMQTIREETFPALLANFAKQVNKELTLINSYSYIGEGNSPMTMLSFKLIKN